MGAVLRARGVCAGPGGGRRHPPGDGTQRGRRPLGFGAGGEMPVSRTGGKCGREQSRGCWTARGCSAEERGPRSGRPWRGWPGSVLKALGAGPPQVRSRRKERPWPEAQEVTRRRAAVARELRGGFRQKCQLLW